MAGHVPGDLRPSEFIENVILVQLMPGKADHDINTLLATFGASVIEPFGANRWGLVEIASGIDFYDALAVFDADGAVDYAHANYVGRVNVGFRPNSGGLPHNEPDDPYYTGSLLAPDDYNHHWAFHNTGQDPPSGMDDADIDAPEAWVLTTGNSSIVMAVIDTGFPVDAQGTLLHPDLNDPDKYVLQISYPNDGWRPGRFSILHEHSASSGRPSSWPATSPGAPRRCRWPFFRG